MRIVSIVGARPQFIKAAPVSKALRESHTEILVHTGQHYDTNMSDVFFKELDIPQPDVSLGISAMSNLEQVSHMMLGLKNVLETHKPDWSLVYGDTNSTLAGAMASQMMGVPVAHIEAGLRSYNRTMPEENNRVLVDHISSALFCPTDQAVINLRREGIEANVFMVGDVMIDALLQNRDKAFQRGCDGILGKHGVAQGDFFLATIHRAANTDNAENIKSIIGAFTDFADTTILLPAHPRLHKALAQNNIAISRNVRLIPPVGYLDMLCLTSAAGLILTDSGGLQKEAYALRTRCVTLRDETEWTETLTHGWNRLAGSVRERIVRAVHDSITEHPTEHPEYYGDGRASLKISEILSSMSH